MSGDHDEEWAADLDAQGAGLRTARRPTVETGWFADCGGREGPEWMREKWQPCLETGKGHIPSFDVWFDTKEACEAYIRDEIIPIAASLLP